MLQLCCCFLVCQSFNFSRLKCVCWMFLFRKFFIQALALFYRSKSSHIVMAFYSLSLHFTVTLMTPQLFILCVCVFFIQLNWPKNMQKLILNDKRLKKRKQSNLILWNKKRILLNLNCFALFGVVLFLAWQVHKQINPNKWRSFHSHSFHPIQS